MKEFLQKPWLMTLLGAIVIVLIVIPSLMYLLRDFLPEPSLTWLDEQAFGELSVDEAATEEAVSGRGGGGDASKLSAYPVVDDMIAYPEYTERYEYLYEGELPDLSTIDATVYRRVDALTLPSSVSAAFSNLSLGIVPLSSFSNLELMNFSLAQEGSDGYSIYADTTSNSISISRNNAYWQTLDYSKTLTSSDLPTDEELASLASQFLTQYGIDTSSFGEASVDRSYIDPDSWIPDTMNVVYPLIVNGTDVWTMYGQPSGLSIFVSLRSDEVEGLYAPGPYTLEASTYGLATDPAEILKVANRGGLWEPVIENATVTYTNKLGEPELILAEHYQYLDDGTSSILYVPALRFPVIEDDPDAPYIHDWVIVPLVQDILDEVNPAPVLFEETVEEDINTKR